MLLKLKIQFPNGIKKVKMFSPYLAVPKVLVCKDEYNPKRRKK